MNSVQNFERMMRGEVYDRIPFDLPMTEPVVQEMERRTGSRDTVETFDTDFRYVGIPFRDRTDEWRAGYLAMGFELPERSFVGGDGYMGRVPPEGTTGAAWHLTEMLHPLSVVQTVHDLESLPFELEGDTTGLPRQVQRIHQEGRVATISLECTVFENAWYRRGMDLLFEDLLEQNGIAEWLLDFYKERSKRAATAASAAGVDLIRLGDDVGTQRGMMLSAKMWREVLKPRLAEVISAAKQAGDAWIQYHSDGDIREIVDDLVEIGVDILNPVQPECMPLDDVIPRWKDRLGFSGMIGTQTTMPFGSQSDVRAAVAECVSWARRGARILVAPTHVLEPDVPWDNIVALAESVRLPLR
jgi:uroporphyrinogen decarboxylase